MKKIIILPTAWQEQTTDFQKQTKKYLSDKNIVFGINLNNKHANIKIFFLFLILKTIKIINKKEIILWINQFQTYAFFYRKKHIFNKIIYDCVDYPKNELAGKNLTEKMLIKNCHYMFVNSKTLKNEYLKLRKKIIIVPQGFRDDVFKSSITKKEKQERKKIGYIGGINFRLNYDLLDKIIKKKQEYDFVFWGPITDYEPNQLNKIEKLLKNKNVIYGYSEDKNEIPNIINSFDLCIIPYDVSKKFNQFCYPMKVMEYFYMQKKIVSAPIEELKKYKKYITIANNYEEWISSIDKSLIDTIDKKEKIEMRKIAINNSWEKKIKKMEKLIDNELNFK